VDLRLNRQDANSAKEKIKEFIPFEKLLYIKAFDFPWRCWRLGGKIF